MTFIITTSSIAEASIPEVGLPVVTLGLAVPAPPTSLTATADGTNPEYVDLAWTASASAPVTGYKVFRALGGSGSYTQIGTTSGVTYDDDTTAAATQYDYYVVAYNNAGDSAASNVDTITTGTAAWTPADLGTDLLSEWDIWDSSKVTLVSGDVSQVTDLQGVANMTPPAATDRPLLSAAAWNGEDIAEFTRTDGDILRTGAVSTYNQLAADVSFGVFTVFAKTRNTAEYIWSHYFGTTAIECYCATNTTFVDASIRINGTSVGVKSFSIADDTRAAVYVGIRRKPTDATRSEYVIYVNGSLVHSDTNFAATTANTTHQNTSMGGRFDDSFHAQSKFGMMAITKYLDATQIGNFFTWANAKFSIY